MGKICKQRGRHAVSVTDTDNQAQHDETPQNNEGL